MDLEEVQEPNEEEIEAHVNEVVLALLPNP